MSTEAREIIRWQILAFVPADTVNEEEMADAVVAALREAGLVIVPREPTQRMAMMGDEALVEQYGDHPEWEDAKDMAEGVEVVPLYRAMISSSEEPTPQPKQE